MTRYYLDTEFLEDGRTIELISIALVSDDGREYYAGNGDCDLSRVFAEPWLRQHVVPHLPAPGTDFWKPRAKIAAEVLAFVKVHGVPEFWADHASYDWVALCQLYGRMIDLPPGMPMFCMDLQQMLVHSSIRRSELPVQDPAAEHDALQDARWLRRAHRFALGLNW
jgi:3' exoribonuclease, RNase T-like